MRRCSVSNSCRPQFARRIVALLEMFSALGIPGKRLIGRKLFVTVTVTVVRMCPPPGQVYEQVFGGTVAERTPALVAHSQAGGVAGDTLTSAVVSEMFGAALTAADCIPLVSCACAVVAEPHCAPARAAFVSSMV